MAQHPVSRRGDQGGPDSDLDPPTPVGPPKPSHSSLHPSLTQPAPFSAVSPVPDRAFLQAAAIFQRLRKDKPNLQRLLHYGKKEETPLPKSRDKTALRRAYQLAFNTLKYQDLLEDVILDCCFHTAQNISEDLLPLAMVMLCDFQERKFLVNKHPTREKGELLPEVKDLESCLNRYKTKLAASLARCRVKQDLWSVSCVLPEPVRTKQHRASALPRYAWVDTLRSSMEEVCAALRAEGACEVEEGVTLDQGRSAFYKEPLCLDTLVLSPTLHMLLQHRELSAGHVLNTQDRGVCIAVGALRGQLSDDTDVLVAGSYSALTVAHVAVCAATRSGRALVCGGDHTPSQREEMEALLTLMDIKNVRVLSEGFLRLDAGDATLQRLSLVLVLPRCSTSAVSDPVHTLLSEDGDWDLLQDLSQGVVSQSKMNTLVAQQARLLAHALTFPKVQTVLYFTRSVYPEENEQLVKRVLEKADTHRKLLPFRVTGPILSESPGSQPDGDGTADKFLRIEPCDRTDGCFIARLTRESDPTKMESVQDVLARAAAKGLLTGILADQLNQRKKGRQKKSRAPAAVVRSDSPSGRGRPSPTGSDAGTRRDPGGRSPVLPDAPSSFEEEGEGRGEATGEEKDDTKNQAGRGKKTKGLRKTKGKLPERRPKRSQGTTEVSGPRPNRGRKKPARKTIKPARPVEVPAGQTGRKPREQLPVVASTLTPTSGSPTPTGRNPSPAPASSKSRHISPKQKQVQNPQSDKPEGPFKEAAKPGVTYKAVERTAKPNKEQMVTHEWLKPVDLLQPRVSSSSLSSNTRNSSRGAVASPASSSSSSPLPPSLRQIRRHLWGKNPRPTF